MANEITLQASINLVNGSISGVMTLSQQIDQNDDKYVRGTQNIGTSEETLGEGDIANPGYLIIQNLDATNYVEVGALTTEYSVKLQAGEIAMFRVNGTSVFCKADTAACDVEYFLLED